MTTGSAKKLARILGATTSKNNDIIEPVDQVLIRRMQSRGIVGDVAGMPEEVAPAEERWRRVLQFLREEKEAAEETERRRAEADKPKPQTAAEMLAAALSQANHSVMPLNGAQVLTAALAGGPGTINGEPV